MRVAIVSKEVKIEQRVILSKEVKVKYRSYNQINPNLDQPNQKNQKKSQSVSAYQLQQLIRRQLPTTIRSFQ